MAEIKEIRVKICLLGAPGVGKTSLINKFVSNLFGEKYLSTIGTKVSKKTINLPNPKPKKKGFFSFGKSIDVYRIGFNIWDVAGQKTWIKIQASYYQGAKAAIVVCDMTRKETLESIPEVVKDLKKVTGEIPLIFLMNKSDLQTQAQISVSDLARVAVNSGSKYYSSSAKTGANVETAFHELGKLLVAEL